MKWTNSEAKKRTCKSEDKTVKQEGKQFVIYISHWTIFKIAFYDLFGLTMTFSAVFKKAHFLIELATLVTPIN